MPGDRRRRRSAVAVVCAVAGLALALAQTRSAGYAVGYTVGGVLAAGVLVVLVGLVLLLPRRSRQAGLYSLLAVVPFVTAFFLSIVVLDRLGAWDEPMIHFGPEVPASLVVLFREEATPGEVNLFLEQVVGVPHPGGGHKLLPGVQSALRVRVGSHVGYAFQLRESVTPEQEARIRARIRSSPVVWRLYEDVAPAAIDPEAL
jgi:MFS family permease